MSGNTVQTTVLPRGGNGNTIDFTVLLTPSIDTDGTLPGAFQDWPSLWKGSGPWTLSVVGAPATVACRPSSAAPSSDLWSTLIEAKLPVKPRSRNKEALDAWLQSHRATRLYLRHSRYRAYDTIHRIAKSHPQLINKDTSAPPDVGAATDLSQYLETIAATVEPENVYIFSSVTPSASQTPVPMKQMLDDRQTALNYAQASLAGLPYSNTLMQRILQGQTTLEEEEGEQLSGPALFALYRHCVQWIGDAAKDAKNPLDLPTVMAAITTAASGLIAVNGSAIDSQTLDNIQDYVEFHLFSKRRIVPTSNTPEPPDFHQLLGLLHQYPSLLRPLGLAFDFQAVDAAFLPNAGSFQISITPPKISNDFTWQPLYTQCQPRPGFAAQSLAGQHKNGFLDIHDVTNFTFVTEDNDGSSQKLVQQKAARARGSEYDTSSPTGVPVQDGRASRGPTKSLPSARTTGIALYQGDRADQLAQSIARNSNTLGSLGNALYLEDITVGYRVDVRDSLSPTWYSLHRRRASYEILSVDGEKTLQQWPPVGTMVEEGFITLAATSTVDPKDKTTQLQLHPAIFAWTGWSLSVPRPRTKRFNDAAPNPNSSLKTVTRLRPILTLEEKGTLPKLRFESIYEFRLRQVDLAGNSLPYTTADAAGTSQTFQNFLRHEPIRAPQILIEKPIDLSHQPSEHVDLMVSRDGASSPNRVLVPPRETHYLAELHGMLDKLDPIPTAFSRQLLMEDGAFPSVAYLFPKHPGSSSEKQDGVFKTFDDPNSQRGVPETPYLPDPLAILARVEPYVLGNDLKSYVPMPTQGGKVLYTPFLADTKWPDTLPVYVQLNPVEKDEAARIRKEELPLKPFVASVAVFGLTVDLPKAATVMLQITSASNDPSSPPALAGPPNHDVAFLVMPETDEQPTPVERTVPNPPSGQKVNLLQVLQTLQLPDVPAPPAPPPPPPPPVAPVPPDGVPDLVVGDIVNFAAAVPNGGAASASNPVRSLAAPAPVTPLASLSQATAFSTLKNNLDPNLLTNGSVHTITPPRKLTLVHAVKRPLEKPGFASAGSLSAKVVNFQVIRPAGTSAATITGKLNAHWLSTSKVTIVAKWTDRIDDLTKPAPQYRTTPEVATEFPNDGKSFGDFSLLVPPVTSSPVNQHRFRDTRAHSVTYSLSAFTRFREYYPGNPSENPEQFTEPGESYSITVLSSVRPPAPVISYIIPAFSWKDCKGLRGRTMVLRVYLARPFLVSGDNETLGVVLLTTDRQANSALVSRWGADPIVTTSGKIVSNTMKATDFLAVQDPTQAPGVLRQVRTFILAETGTADVLPFSVDYAAERQLWYCDIPLSPSQTESAFARLAFVRWQPDSLNHDNIDLRASPIVFADFMQIRADRWVYFERQDAQHVKVSVSGIFRTADPAYPDEAIIRCKIQQRWHRLGDDDRNADWRPLIDAPAFTFQSPDAGSAVGGWHATIKFPHSTNLYKYRLVIEEKEYMNTDKSKAFGQTDDKRGCRYTYLHYIEL
jgi:hypothetical protein